MNDFDKLLEQVKNINEHSLTATVRVGDKVRVTTAKINRKGVVADVSSHGDIVSVTFPGEHGEQTFYADDVHWLHEGVVDVVARDTTFPHHRFFVKQNNKIIGMSSAPISKGNWKRVSNIIGDEDTFVDLVKKNSIKNVVSTRPLGKEKETLGNVKENISESKDSEMAKLDGMCKSLVNVDQGFVDYMLQRGVGPETYGDTQNNTYKSFLMNMKDEIKQKFGAK